MTKILFVVFTYVLVISSIRANLSNRILQQSNCSLYNDCLNCTAADTEQCSWNNNQCSYNR